VFDRRVPAADRNVLSEAQFLAWGWRVPFLASAVLVLVGLWVRLRIEETPAFRRRAGKATSACACRCSTCCASTHALVLGTFSAVATFVLFYLMTVFTLSWGTSSWATRGRSSSSCR
jgi:hypothetical protein